MLPLKPLARTLRQGSLALLCAVPLAAGAARGELVELGEVESTSVRDLTTDFKAKMQRDLGSRAAEFQTFGPQIVFQQMFQQHMTNTVPSRGLKYTSKDAQGHDRTYSGRIYLPSRNPGSAPTSLPLVIYQHATETRRLFTSYYKKGDESLLGALAAESCDFAVAMPDGDGMGADPSPAMHAYCHGPTTAMCLIDMIRALQGNPRIFDGQNYVWDGRVFIVGYSEGGYIAMAAVKELCTNPEYKDIKLTGAACMGGPFDFSTSTRKLLADATTPYGRPYIPAYFLAAWAGLYPHDISLPDALNPQLLGTQPRVAGLDSGNAVNWLDGVLGGDQITPRMQARMTGKKDQLVPARSLLNEAWLKINLDPPSSRLNQLLKDNDLVGHWAPPDTLPVLLVHDPYDETVGYDNAQSMYNSWLDQKVHPIGIVDLALGSRGTGHVGGAIVAIPTAFIWIDANMPRSLMAMTAQSISTAIKAQVPDSMKEGVDVLATMASGDSNDNRALFPLSRIDYRPGPGAKPYKVSFADLLFVKGKVKFYTVSDRPQFPGQTQTPGTGGYTRYLAQMKDKGDTFSIKPNELCYMAVYPGAGLVALTLKFEGGSGKGGPYVINIKQVKNKIVGRNISASLDVKGNFKPLVDPSSYENLDTGKPFIVLP
jgi:pimeloyl-ACP methyl ester carboxylesterase